MVSDPLLDVDIFNKSHVIAAEHEFNSLLSQVADSKSTLLALLFNVTVWARWEIPVVALGERLGEVTVISKDH